MNTEWCFRKPSVFIITTKHERDDGRQYWSSNGVRDVLRGGEGLGMEEERGGFQRPRILESREEEFEYEVEDKDIRT